MNRLADFIRFTPKKSSVDVPCEVVPGHMTQRYVEVAVTRTVIVDLDGQARPVEVDVKLRACSACYARFVYDAMATSKDIESV